MTAPQKLQKAREAKKKAVELYGGWKAVNGIGISSSNGDYAIKINLETELDGEQKISREIDGVPVVTKMVGKISKQ
ncbi:hypothetical protein [Stieleria varia]|uniref:Uncharacterized protein n=1 Tax=Stieleria varia TaxID=2528005 RepID=A0A5C6AQS4_9BACT|nr:hypothetical protein [Stieleria varia]TWU02393.1 hypothetical protein Pla52n_34430 [Stieleria varia]